MNVHRARRASFYRPPPAVKWRRQLKGIVTSHFPEARYIPGQPAAGAAGRTSALRASEASTAWNFDWDDNIFNMPTKILVRHKVTGEEVGISTADWALVRETVGKSGKYADYQEYDGSLRMFGDDPTGERNYFLEDVLQAMAKNPEGCKGPSWQAFVKACSNEETAKHATIITARLCSPKTIHDALRELQKRGIIKFVPPLENLYPVNYPPLKAELGGTAQNPSAAKAIVMRRILDKLEASPLPKNARWVTSADGTTLQQLHLWGFSDDDYGNYAKARDALAEGIRQGKWKNIKIVLFFTGTNRPDQQPRAEVLMPNGEVRPARPEEAKHVPLLRKASATTHCIEEMLPRLAS